MAELSPMPPIQIDNALLQTWGQTWLGTVTDTGTKPAESFSKKQGMDFGNMIDTAVGTSVSAMLGNIPIVKPNMKILR